LRLRRKNRRPQPPGKNQNLTMIPFRSDPRSRGNIEPTLPATPLRRFQRRAIPPSTPFTVRSSCDPSP
jgi:hypothetical protein